MGEALGGWGSFDRSHCRSESHSGVLQHRWCIMLLKTIMMAVGTVVVDLGWFECGVIICIDVGVYVIVTDTIVIGKCLVIALDPSMLMGFCEHR